MSYATQTDLIDHLGLNGAATLAQLTDPNGLMINTLAVAKGLTRADEEINARLVGVTLPLTFPYPPLLVSLACIIAIYWMYGNGRPEFVEKDYDRAIKLLADIREGRASLGLSGDGSGPVEQSGDDVAFVSVSPVFSRDALKEF